jgi:hypothetical protein
MKIPATVETSVTEQRGGTAKMWVAGPELGSVEVTEVNQDYKLAIVRPMTNAGGHSLWKGSAHVSLSRHHARQLVAELAAKLGLTVSET